MPRGFESRGKMLDRRRSRTPRGRKTLLVLGACAVLLLAAGVRRARAASNTAAGRPQVLRNVGIDQNLNQQIPLDLTFRDETGKPVELRQYFGKKPVVLSLVYFSCPMLCTMVEQNLLQALKQISFNVGDQYDVLTVSFDPHDTPEMASAKRDVYVGLYGRK